MASKLELDNGTFFVRDIVDIQALDRGFFGNFPQAKKVLMRLAPEEALYLIDVRNATCETKNKTLSFNQVAQGFARAKKFLARYFCYKDWRDRGLIARSITEASGNYGASPLVKYPSHAYEAPRVKAHALWFTDDLFSVIDDEQQGRALYDEEWFGQYGTYKAKKHGRFTKLDAYETIFLAKHGGMKTSTPIAAIEKEARKRRKDFTSLYAVYEDWRMRGYVPKTGFKFGTHFRLYFPGAKPGGETDDWAHSKHVIHVFPREERLLISEWARAIRVAHSVKKTFILAIPGQKKASDKAELDFLLFHREGDRAENPKNDKPKFAMLALSEEEEIGGAELAAAIEQAQSLGLDLILSICDRETSVTHYRVKRIELPGAVFKYYEIEWIQP
ncbi:MAG TPA: tRNA-intron lyase [Candidatus Norongarragalinales archaeon]|jgi:tRNA-intron endonuclease|nr:tRNA-intron lyase [Candidatus Norongarragalinales archaeon]